MGGQGTRVISSPEACRDVCLSVLEQVPDNAERTRLQNIMVSELERVGEETESSTAYWKRRASHARVQSPRELTATASRAASEAACTVSRTE